MDESRSSSSEDEVQPAEISRDRRLPSNKSAQSQAVRGERKLKKKNLYERVKEFRGETLEIRAGSLFCGCCHEFVSEKKSSVKSHVGSKKHLSSKKKRQDSKLRDQSLKEALARRDRESRPVGETLPLEQRLYRLKVVRVFLREGIPLSKVAGMRELLEEHSYRLTTSGHLAEYIGVVLKEERKAVAEEIAGRPISVIFDGCCRLGEAIAIVLRFVDDHWNICQRLARLRTVAKAVNAADLAQVLNQCLAAQYQIEGERVMACMRDGVAVNGAAIRNLAVLYPNLLDVVCFSHTANNAGKHFDFPILEEFGRLWISLFSHSAAAKLAWKARTGSAIRTHSETRWWSKWEIYSQIATFFGDVQPFVEDNLHISPTTTAKLQQLLQDQGDLKTLRLQLAAMIDVGRHLVEVTYLLEGDGPLIFTCYQKLQAVTTALAQKNLPSLKAVARQLAEQDASVDADALVTETMQGAQPAIDYFRRKFNVDLGSTVTAFKRARIFDPVVAQGLNLMPADIQSLRCFSFFDEAAILQGLADQLPHYLAAIVDANLATADEKWKWWSRQRDDPNLCHWCNAVKKLVLVQPSSAASERVFSLLAAAYTDEQERALEDGIEASIMLRYNHRH